MASSHNGYTEVTKLLLHQSRIDVNVQDKAGTFLVLTIIEIYLELQIQKKLSAQSNHVKAI